MMNISARLKTFTTLICVLACSGVVMLWPEWRTELQAQSYSTFTDHTLCYKVQDQLEVKCPGNVHCLGIDAPQFLPANCRIHQVRERLFCVPAAKDAPLVVTRDTRPGVRGRFEPFQPSFFPGDFIGQDQICYRVTCDEQFPTPPNPSLDVADQFGARTISKLRPFLLCGPAVKASCADPARMTFAGGRLSGACQQFSNDPTSCEQAWHIGADGNPSSCFFGTNNRGETGCFGCGPTNEQNVKCTNTCL